MVLEDEYRAPVLTDTSWARAIPARPFDALYSRCPNEQTIVVFRTIMCGKYDYSEMSPADYAKRIYQNSYFSFGGKLLCGRYSSPFIEKSFKKLVGEPVVDNGKRRFSMVHETELNYHLCSSTPGLQKVKIMDAFIEDPKEYFLAGAHTRFVVFRYMSPIDKFDDGVQDFKDMVSRFQWERQGD
jgi:hypothetical protein